MGGSLTACSQGQASGAASDEVVQRVIGLLSDLGADAGGEAKYSTDGGCWGAGGGVSADQGPGASARRAPKEKPRLAHLQ